jgi:RimJ/RimL family protein N-acetyltransferase
VPEIPLPSPPLSDGDILLRPWSLDDVPAATPLLRDPEIPRWTTVPRDYTERDGREFMGSSAARRVAGAALELAAVDAGDGTLLGSVGLQKLDWEQRSGEIGYWVAAAARRRGVATRAVRLLGGYALVELGLRRIEIIVHADNVASQGVAERAGAVREGVDRREIGHHGVCDVVVYALVPTPAPTP